MYKWIQISHASDVFSLTFSIIFAFVCISTGFALVSGYRCMCQRKFGAVYQS